MVKLSPFLAKPTSHHDRTESGNKPRLASFRGGELR